MENIPNVFLYTFLMKSKSIHSISRTFKWKYPKTRANFLTNFRTKQPFLQVSDMTQENVSQILICSTYNDMFDAYTELIDRLSYC